MGAKWRTALASAMNQNQEMFFRQSASEMRVFERLRPLINGNSLEQCHGLHYLQIATEKLSKAYFLRRGPIKNSHKYFSKFWRALPTAGRVRRALGYADSRVYRNALLTVASLVARIEELAPDLAAQRPNPEYPWPEPSYEHAPADFRFPLWNQIEFGQDGQLLMHILQVLFLNAPNCF
jgi:hypothetical protein